MARKAPNFIGGNKGKYFLAQKRLADKQKQLAALAAKVGLSIEPDGRAARDDWPSDFDGRPGTSLRGGEQMTPSRVDVPRAHLGLLPRFERRTSAALRIH